MKTLKDYISSMITEASSPMIMLTSFEDAKEYFKDRPYFKDGIIFTNKKKTPFITIDQIEQLYEFAEENGRPCPIIANYKGNDGDFVFRRWVGGAEVFGEEDSAFKDSLFNASKPYKGLHNTSLKEDGKWFPNSEDFESIIAFVHNKELSDRKAVKEFSDDIENIEFVTGKKCTPNSKSEQLMNYCEMNFENLKLLIECLPNDCGPLQKLHKGNKATSKWIELGSYDKFGKAPSNVPKTDLISSDGKYKISLKKHDGSQLMSAGRCESEATIVAALGESIRKNKLFKELFPENEYLWVNNLNTLGNKNKLEKETGKTLNSQLNNTLKEFVQKVDVKKIMVEAASGEVKFGGGNSSANCVLVWDEIKYSNNSFYNNIESYIDEKIGKASFIIAYKTANDRSSTSLRVITK